MACKKVIGIISYFPDSAEVRNQRLGKLIHLIKCCDVLFNLPIIIIAQNWSGESQHIKSKNVKIVEFKNALGIWGARNELRKYFINSNYDYLIMLDDDCLILGTDGKDYLKQIDLNPDCFIEFNKTLLKLFAISKTLYKKVEIPKIEPEKQEGFEDRVFVNYLRKKYPDKRRVFNTTLKEYSINTADKCSTWFNDKIDLKLMNNNTENIIKDIK